MQTPRTITLKEARARLKLYVMRAGQSHIKIGVAIDPESRLMAIQTGSFHKVTIEAIGEYENARLAERAWHERLSKHRTNGEWFTLSHREIACVVRMVGRCAVPRCGVVVSGFSVRETWESPLRRAGLPKRAVTTIEEHGIKTLAELAKLTPTEIMRMRNMGKKTMGEVASVLVKNKLWES